MTHFQKTQRIHISPLTGKVVQHPQHPAQGVDAGRMADVQEGFGIAGNLADSAIGRLQQVNRRLGAPDNQKLEALLVMGHIDEAPTAHELPELPCDRVHAERW